MCSICSRLKKYSNMFVKKHQYISQTKFISGVVQTSNYFVNNLWFLSKDEFANWIQIRSFEMSMSQSKKYFFRTNCSLVHWKWFEAAHLSIIIFNDFVFVEREKKTSWMMACEWPNEKKLYCYDWSFIENHIKAVARFYWVEQNF